MYSPVLDCFEVEAQPIAVSSRAAMESVAIRLIRVIGFIRL
jgi:hypothetical protein